MATTSYKRQQSGNRTNTHLAQDDNTTTGIYARVAGGRLDTCIPIISKINDVIYNSSSNSINLLEWKVQQTMSL